MNPRLFTGILPDGQQILVTIWPGDAGAEVAFRAAPEQRLTWSVPTELMEERPAPTPTRRLCVCTVPGPLGETDTLGHDLSGVPE